MIDSQITVSPDEDRRPRFRQLVKHRYNRRMKGFDYKGNHIYFITLKRSREVPALSSLCGDVTRVGGLVYAMPTDVGHIFLECLAEFFDNYPMIKGGMKVVMPDHVHIIFRVTERLERDFGWYLGKLKSRCTSRFWEHYPEYKSRKISYFIKKGDTDKILFGKDQLQRWEFYIVENPRRALVRKFFPDFFQRTMVITSKLGSHPSYGNIFLLKHPEKVVVRYTSKLSERDNEINLENARIKAQEGCVLVSPFIHEREDEIYKMGLRRGWRMIRIIEYGLPARKHPYKEEFNYCSTGNYLLVSLNTERVPDRGKPSRRVCMMMNDLATQIVEEDFSSATFRRE